MISEGWKPIDIQDTTKIYRMQEDMTPDDIEGKIQADLNIPGFKLTDKIKELIGGKYGN